MGQGGGGDRAEFVGFGVGGWLVGVCAVGAVGGGCCILKESESRYME